MFWMILGLVLFLGTHSLSLYAPNWRDEARASMGEATWKSLYAVMSLLGLGMAIWGYGQMRMTPVDLWQPPLFLQHLVALLTLPAFILLVAAYIPANHLRVRLGHPMLLAVKLWAFVHLLANGRLGDVVFFGAFLLWGTALFVRLRGRDRLAGAIPPVPLMRNTAVAVVLGALAWIIFAFYLHPYVAGVPAFRIN